ncbi:hypothetical protein ACET3Z_014194 [Daucus carota]
MMLACIAVTLVFRDPGKLGNAYGVAIVFMMIITSSLLIIIMIMVRRTHSPDNHLYCYYRRISGNNVHME